MARAQGAQANAKEDTRFLALGGALTTDLSQRLTNITASGAGAYEAPSTRSILAGDRTVSVRWTATAAEVGVVLIVCANAAQTDIVWSIATDGAGKLCAYINASVGVLSTTNAVAAKDYTVSVSQRANPDTTGASDAVISELVLYNHTDGTVDDIVQAAHVVPTTATGPYNLSVGGWWNGLLLTNVPTNAPTEARVSSSYHPPAEVFEDWVGARTAYAGTAADGPVEPIGPRPSSSGLGDESQFAGRANFAYPAALALAVRKRSWSPAVNELLNDDAEMPTAQQDHWASSPPGDSRYTFDLAWLRWVTVPAEATHVRVRVHVRQWVTAGLAVELGIRCYALNRPHTKAKIGAQDAPSLTAYYREALSTLDDEFGPGVWLDLGAVALPRFDAQISGWTNTVHLALAYAVDPNETSGNDANARFVIDGWTAVPAVLDIPWAVQDL
jgi:hypothetical protein